MPAGTATVPVAAHWLLVETEQESADAVIDPGIPVRSVTVMVPDCCEYTDSVVAVHPAGTQVSTAGVSVSAPFVLPTE